MTKSSAKRVRAESAVKLGAKLSRAGLMLGSALGCSIAVFTTFKPTPVLAADVTCAPDASGSTTSGPQFCQNAGDKVSYTANGDLTVVLDNVVTTGAAAIGVDVDATGGKYSVSVYDLFKAGSLNGTFAGVRVDGVGGDSSIRVDLSTGSSASGGTVGIDAFNNTAGGSGTIKVTTGSGAVVGGSVGVYARGYNGALSVDAGSGGVYGKTTGVYARANSGNLNVKVHGTVDGDTDNNGVGEGVHTVQNSGGTTHIVVDAKATIRGGDGSTGKVGVDALSGLGPVTIDTEGRIFDGLAARSNGPTGYGAVTVNNGGIVYGNQGDAVKLRALGGTVSLYQASGGEAIATNGHGVYAFAGDGGISIKTLTDTYIGGSKGGIYASTLTSKGSINITTGGGVYSSAGDGITARASGGDINITTYDHVRGDPGIAASNTGSGNVTEHINSNVYATAGGVVVGAEAGTVDIEVGNGAHIYSQNAGGGLDGVNLTVKDGHILVNGNDAGVGITADGDGIHAVATQVTAGGTAISVNWQGSIDAGKTGVNLSAASGPISAYVGGPITAHDDGVRVKTGGANAVYVGTKGVVKAATGTGIYAFSTAGTVKVEADDHVYGGTEGVHAANSGEQRVMVTTLNGVTSYNGDAIFAKSAGGDVRVGYADGGLVLHGAIKATGGDGVYAATIGKGHVEVSGDSSVTIDSDHYGVHTKTVDGVTTINLAGDVNSKLTGVYAFSAGTGEVDISVAGVTSTQGSGVGVITNGGPTFVTATSTVQGAANGAYLYAAKGGDIHVDGKNLYGGDGDGVFASVKGDGSITIKGDTIGGGTYGVFSRVSGQGSIYLNATGAVSGTSGAGVYARLSDIAGTGDITVVTGGKASGGTYGAYASNRGTGHISITTGGAYGQTKAGIAAFATAGYVYVHSTGAVSGATYGITANAYAASPVTIHADSDVTGTNDVGVRAFSGGGAVYVGVGGAVKGGTDGVSAYTSAASAVTVKVTGDAYGGSATGVRAVSAGGDVQVYVGGAAHGGTAGVYAATNGATAGGVSVTVKGDASGYGDAGVNAQVQSASASGDVKVSVGGSVYGATRGVFAYNAGTGGVDVGVTGHVYSNGGDGVRAVVGNAAATGDVKVNVGSYVTAHGGAGVYADNRGSGGVSVSTGAVSSDTTNGIYARSVSGGVYVHATGLVQTSASATAIVGNVSAGGGDVTIHADGGAYSQGSDAINALAHGGKITISAGDAVHGANYGIAAFNDTAGNISITASGSVTGDTQMGVQASAKGGGNVYVSVSGPVKAGTTGVHAVADGAGYVTVYAKGGLTTKNGAGVDAQTVDGAITVNTYGGKLIAKGGDGIRATSSGSGSISITTDYVRSTSGRGIYATTATGGIIVNSSGFVWGYGRGVDVKTSGSGDVSVTTSGGVRSDHGYGIRAYSKGGGVKVYTGYVGAYSAGIIAISDSATADVKVVASSQVNSTKSRGILAYNLNSGATGQVYVSVADSITTAGSGVVANNAGTGSVYVGTRGVSAKYGDGVNAIGRGDVYVHNTYGSDIQAGGDGVFAQSTGAGKVTVYAGGDVTSKYGRAVYAGSKGGNVGVTVYGDASGSGNAIEVRTSGKGYGGVYVAGKVISTSFNGIYVTAGSGGASVTAPGKIYAYGGDGVHVVSTGKSGAYVGAVSATGAGVYVSGGKFVRAVGGLNGGDIVAGGNGIEVITTGASKAYIASLGNVHSIGGNYALHASSQGGYAQIRTYGDVTADAGDGIVASSTGKGDVRVATYNGFLGSKAATITAAGDGIRVTSDQGNLDVLSYAAIVADPGIVMKTGGSGTVIVDSFGAITAKNGGIVTSTASGYNHVYLYGTVEGDSDQNGSGDAIHAVSNSGHVVVHTYAGGDIGGKSFNGVYAKSSGGVDITVDGSIGSNALAVQGAGVVARNYNSISHANVYGSGAIFAQGAGIDIAGISSAKVDFSGAISAGGAGVQVYTSGYLTDIDIHTSGAISAGADGVYARHGASAATTEINASGLIDAHGDGINAIGGDIQITESGGVTGAATTGIHVYTGGEASIVATGAIGSSSDHVSGAGISAYAYNGVVVTAGAISADGMGISAGAGRGAGAKLYAKGDVISGGVSAIHAYNNAYGAVLVRTYGDVTATAGDGIFAHSGTGGVEIDTAAGKTIHASGDGIRVTSDSGSITVTSKSAMIADPGINLSTGGAGVISVGSFGAITAKNGGVVTATVDGYNHVYVHGTVEGDSDNNGSGSGILATSSGAGAVSVRTYAGADIVGHNYSGIVARGFGASSGVTVQHDGNVGTAGIYVDNGGVVAILSGGGSGSIKVKGSGLVYAGSVGVYANSNATGSIAINETGDIHSKGAGIAANRNTAGGTGDITVTTNKINAGVNGIDARQIGGGSGKIGVYANGAIVAGTGSGVYARSNASGDIVIKTAKAVNTSGLYGVYALDTGAGNIAITANGTVSAVRDAIRGRISNAASTGSITVNAYGTLSSTQEWGVQAFNYGKGDITITTASTANVSGVAYGGVVGIGAGAITVHLNGDVGSKADAVTGGGIYTHAVGGSKTISIDGSGKIYAGHTGIYARNEGSTGAIYVNHQTAAATIVAGGNGIDARATAIGTGAITVKNAASITAGGVGILARRNGASSTGVISITNSGLIDAGGNGIDVLNIGKGGIVITDTGGVTGKASTGIRAFAQGGDITVHSNGDIGSKADSVTAFGVYAYGQGASGLVTVDGAGRIYAGASGVFAAAAGKDGSVYVNHAGGTIVAGSFGINAHTFGAGSGTVTVKNVASITAGADGIRAYASNAGATGAISVTNSGLLDAVFTGIYARNDGTGGVTVTDTGGITGKAGNGIVVHGAGGNLIVHNNGDIGSKATAVANFGVYVHDTAGSGTVTIDGTGKIYAGGTGLYGRHDGAGGSVYINHQTAAATIHAGGRGIYGETTGSGAGAITIKNAAAIVASGTGIQAYASSAGNTGLIKIVNSGLIDSGASGIYAANAGSGGISVTDSGGITGKAALGIVATERGSAGDVYVAANASIGSSADHVSQFGIFARNTKGGTGAVRVHAHGVYADSSGIVTVQTGAGYNGVRAYGAVVSAETAKGGAGISASSASGYTSVRTYGNITAANNGIVVTSTTGDIGIYTQGGHLIAAKAGDGVYAGSTSGSITVNSHANITADPGINLKSGGAGVINVYSYGTISAMNGGIVTETQNGNNSVFVHNTVEGDSDNNNVGDGIHAHATGTGSVLVHTYAGGDIVGNNVVGIYAVNDGKSGNVKVIADGNIGTGALAVDGSGVNAWVNSGGSGNVSVSGAGTIFAASRGIYAFSNGSGSITVNTTGNITSKLGDGVFARANGASSGVSVTTTGAITAAGVGIYAGENNAAATGAVSVNASGLIDAAAAGIRTTNAGAGGITVTDTGGITGKASGGIFALGAGGNVTIHNNADIGSKADAVTNYGVYARDTAGSGAVTVDGTGRIYAGTVGIFALHDGAGGSVYVNHQTAGATINAGKRGIDARTTGAGAGTITVKNTAAITAGTEGIYARMFNAGATGAITITNSGFIDNGGTGIYAANAGTGGIIITDTGGISGKAANGIVASGAGGNVTVHNNADIGSKADLVTVFGVYAGDSAGSGVTTVDGTGRIYAGNTGIAARHNGAGGSVYVNHQTASASIRAGSKGIDARTGGAGAGTIVVKNAATITTNGDGIFAYASNAGNTGLVSVTNSGYVDAHSRGLLANSRGSGGVIVTDTGGINGDATWGIVAQAYGGGTSTVHHNAAIGSSVNGVGFDGVYASVQAGSGAVTVDGSGVIWADRWGVYAFNTGGTNNASILVTNTAAVHGGVDGIRVRGAGTGASALTVNNSAKVYGGTGDGISAIQSNAANTGAVTITSSAAVVGGKAGVRMGNAGSGGATFNNNNTTVYGAKYGVYSNTATTTVINNNTSSVISGKGGFAIDVTGGATTINNQGGSRIFGYAHLAGGNDVLNNNANGKWYAYGTTSFAGGTDTTNNAGTIFVAPFNGAATTVNWTGLEVFNNQGGIIDLRQSVGHTGDVFNLGAAAFTGTTVGTNDSRLMVDVNLSAALATDEIVIGAAAGNTSVMIRDINPSAVGAINLTGVTVVDATSGTGAEFHMVPAVVDKGFVQYELRYFAGPSNWNIVGLPSAEGFEMLKSVEAGQDFWRHTADVWTARRQEARDANWGHEQRSEGWEMWAQAHAGGQQSDRIQSFVVGPFTLTHNLSVDSDWRGFQMGGDHHGAGAGAWDWGFTGGFMQQESRIHADRNSFDLEGWNVGAWTGVQSGSFFANGLIKGDWFSLDANMHTVPAMGHFDGHSWGVKGEAGWRMGSSNFYFEPVADVDWISTHLDSVDFGAAGASFTFKDATSAKGSIGARLGGQWGSLIPYVGLSLVDEFQRSNGMTMITGGGCPAACVTLNDTRPAAYGKADFGFTVKSWGGLEGFLKGEELFSGDYSGFTGRLGVRWRW